MTPAAVHIVRDGHVAILTFARPPHNLADLALIEAIGAGFDAADADPQVRAIVLQSDGGIFCAGADLARDNPVAEERGAGSRNPFYVAAARLFGMQTPVVAAIANVVALGFHPGFGISAVLDRVIGRQRALLMALAGRLAALVERQTDHELAEQARLQKTADFAEGVRVVNERRPGRFVGA